LRTRARMMWCSFEHSRCRSHGWFWTLPDRQHAAAITMDHSACSCPGKILWCTLFPFDLVLEY
jgi:hypothetical protein